MLIRRLLAINHEIIRDPRPVKPVIPGFASRGDDPGIANSNNLHLLDGLWKSDSPGQPDSLRLITFKYCSVR